MFKLMDKKIIAILRKHFLVNWPYEVPKISCVGSFILQSPVCSIPVSFSVNSHPSTVTANSSSGVSSEVSHDDSSQASRLPPQKSHVLALLFYSPQCVQYQCLPQ